MQSGSIPTTESGIHRKLKFISRSRMSAVQNLKQAIMSKNWAAGCISGRHWLPTTAQASNLHPGWFVLCGIPDKLFSCDAGWLFLNCY